MCSFLKYRLCCSRWEQEHIPPTVPSCTWTSYDYTAPFSTMMSSTKEIADTTTFRNEPTSNLFQPKPTSSSISDGAAPTSKRLFPLSLINMYYVLLHVFAASCISISP